MSIIDYFPEYKIASVVIERQTSSSYNAGGEVQFVNTTIFTGSGWFWLGGDSELLANQQEKDSGSWNLIIKSADVTTMFNELDIATIDGDTGYRISQVQKFFDSKEFFLCTVTRLEGV